MRLKQSYLSYIRYLKLKKRHSILICVPTFRSAKITRDAVRRLRLQKNISFDILIIDNGSEDYKELIKYDPKIQYVVLKKNTGNSGAQRIGIELALKYQYEYVVCTDNDAFLLNNWGLSKLYQKIRIEQDIDCTAANHCDNLIKKDEVRTKQLPMHFLFIKCRVFERTDPHNFFIFFVAEDVSLVSKLITRGKVVLCHDVLYYHDAFKPKFLQNFTIYFGIRGFLAILFLEKNISFKLKLYHFFHMFYYPVLALFHSVILNDSTYLQTVLLALYDFTFRYTSINIKRIPENKFIFVRSLKPLTHAVPMTTMSSLLLKNEYRWYSNYYRKNQYFKLVKNEHLDA